MAAAGCRKNANFRGDSNPLGPGDPQNSQDAKKCSYKAFGITAVDYQVVLSGL